MKSLLSRIARVTLAASCGLGLAALTTGCGLGNAAAPDSSDTLVKGFTGTVKGGISPIIGARIVLYATSTAGYGGAPSSSLEANQVGASAHQDTTNLGGFSFPNTGFTCAAGQYAYIVAYGGNTGAGSNNPNSVLMAALGSCSSLYSGTGYTGPNVLINEVTTAAAAYALSNFITVTGNALTAGNNTNGYTVNVSSDAANGGTTGCVSNAYYGTGACPSTRTAGLAHAFANAAVLVSTYTGLPNNTTPTGATIPTQEINTLGDILQACVNSTGGGTSTITGLPTTTTTAAGGTTHDGTACGKLFAFTSYTSNGNTTDAATPGTLTAAGNTLSAIQNLAKRPTGSATLFGSTCGSGTTGTTSAVSCIYGLQPSNGFYQTSMTSAPPDWILGISYPKGSFGTAPNGAACGGVTPATNAMLYPFAIATDINDNITILNEDSSSGICYNLLTVQFDGTSIGGSGFDNTTAFPLNVATDSFGHAIVPAKGTTNNGIFVYAAGPNDSNISLATSLTAASNTAYSVPQYVAVDGNDDIAYSARTPGGIAAFTNAATRSHSAPTYSTPVGATTTASTNQIYLDVNGVSLTMLSSGSGTGKVDGLPNGATAVVASSSLGGSTSQAALTADPSNNGYIAMSDVNTSAVTKTVIQKFTYSVTGTTFAFTTQPAGIAAPTYTFPNTTISPTPGVMDGNNVMWFAERSNAAISGAVVTSGHLNGYDTVNNYGTLNLQGCKFLNTSNTVCGSTDTTTGTSTPYLLYQDRGIAIDAAGDIWVVSGSQGQLNEIIGLAAPTYPLFIHNGTTYKP